LPVLAKAKNMNKTELIIGKRHLRRLEVLVDVTFALLLWDIMTTLPQPTQQEWESSSLGEFLSANTDLGLILIGVIIVLSYWARNNASTGNLKATNGTHASLSIMQLIFLLLYAYCVGMGVQFDGDPLSLALQSVTLFLAGVFGLAAFTYAARNGRLLAKHATEKSVSGQLVLGLGEPLTALITLPLAFVSMFAWELGWLIYIPLAWFLGRKSAALRRSFKIEASDDESV
jgi:hypothetical protein